MDSSDLDSHLTYVSLDPHESAPKRHLDRLTRFYTDHACVQCIYTDTQTTLRVTSVGIGRIYAVHATLPDNKQSVVRSNSVSNTYS